MNKNGFNSELEQFIVYEELLDEAKKSHGAECSGSGCLATVLMVIGLSAGFALELFSMLAAL